MNEANLTHVPADLKIYFTRDYSRFKNLTGNRLLDEAKIKRITKDILSGHDMLRFCPIIVDKKMQVIDGQHRLWVARKLKSNIWYVIADEMAIQDVAKMNSNTSKWKLRDFMHCYISQGKAAYSYLQEFHQKYQLPFGVCMNMLLYGSPGGGGAGEKAKIAFERGDFQMAFEKEATELAELVIRFNKSPDHRHRNFIVAIEILKNKAIVDFDKLLKKFNDNTEQIAGCSSHKEFLQQLENVYNINNHKRITIF